MWWPKWSDSKIPRAFHSSVVLTIEDGRWVIPAENDFREKTVFADGRARSVWYILGPSGTFSDVAGSWTALELGGSGGVLAGLMSNQFKRTICIDIKDQQKQYSGDFLRLLKEKFKKNGRDVDYGKLEFQVASAMDLPYKDGLFDIVYSCNAFEHTPDPINGTPRSAPGD